MISVHLCISHHHTAASTASTCILTHLIAFPCSSTSTHVRSHLLSVSSCCTFTFLDSYFWSLFSFRFPCVATCAGVLLLLLPSCSPRVVFFYIYFFLISIFYFSISFHFFYFSIFHLFFSISFIFLYFHFTSFFSSQFFVSTFFSFPFVISIFHFHFFSHFFISIFFYFCFPFSFFVTILISFFISIFSFPFFISIFFVHFHLLFFHCFISIFFISVELFFSHHLFFRLVPPRPTYVHTFSPSRSHAVPSPYWIPISDRYSHSDFLAFLHPPASSCPCFRHCFLVFPFFPPSLCPEPLLFSWPWCVWPFVISPLITLRC